MKMTLDTPTPSLSSLQAGAGSGREVLSKLARWGLVARGVVYGVIGVLAIGLATRTGGRTESQTGALRTIAHQPFGKIVLIALAIGLAGYAAWRLLEGISGFKAGETAGAGHRVAAIASGVAYAALCAIAVQILVGSRPSGGGAKHATAGVLGWPGGPVFVAIAGVALIGAALYQGYKGIARKFLEDSDVQRMTPEGRKAFTALGVAGYCARATTFLLIGYGVIRAAVDYSPKSAVGLDGALRELVHASYGPILLGLVAAGFIAFAAFSITDSRYHRV